MRQRLTNPSIQGGEGDARLARSTVLGNFVGMASELLRVVLGIVEVSPQGDCKGHPRGIDRSDGDREEAA